MAMVWYVLMDSLRLFVVALPIFFVWQAVVLHQDRMPMIASLSHMLVFTVFVFYICGVCSLTGLTQLGERFLFAPEFSMIPFDKFGQDYMQFILNVIFFVPLGVLLPVLWKSYRGVGGILAAGFGLSMAIEVLQMFCLRISDINDLAMNTLGALIGWGIWLAMDAAWQKVKGKGQGQEKDLGDVIPNTPDKGLYPLTR